MKPFFFLKYLVIFFSLFLCFSQKYFSQNTSKYTITAEAKSLMCPYLSPKFISLLEKEGATNIIKHENHSITFETDREKQITDKRILELVDNVGYEPKLFKISIANE